MIVEAKQTRVVDVEVDPSFFMNELYTLYRASIGVPFDARLRGGYWTTTDDPRLPPERVRLATREELERVEAFRLMFKVVEEIE